MDYCNEFGMEHCKDVTRDAYVKYVVENFIPGSKITLVLKKKLFSAFKEYLQTKVFFS
jgi:hypothetical protein